MNSKQVLSALLTAMILLIFASAASADEGGCSIESNPEAQYTGDPLGSQIDDILTDSEFVFLIFYADWCHFCHQQMPIIDELEEEYAGKIVFIRINVDERPGYAEEFGVSGLPTMIIISGKNGEEHAKEEISGFTEKTRLRETITSGGKHESSDAGDSTDTNPLQAEIGNDIVDDVTATARQPVHSFKPTATATASPIITWEYDQIQPAVAYNSQMDEHLVVWEDHHWGWGNDWDIYGRRVGADGATLGNHFGISWEGSNPRLAPDVAYNDANGEFLVVWEYEHSSDDHDIYARRVASNGTLIGGEIAIAMLTTFEGSPTVAYNSAGGEYLIVWERRAGIDEFIHNDIYGQRLGADGALLGDPVIIASDFQDELAPAVAYGGNGMCMVAWQDKQPGTGAYNIRGYLVGGDGSLLSSEITIATWEYDLVKPRLAFNSAANEFMVVWEDHRWGWGDDWNIYGQRVHADGALVGDNFGISWEGVNHYVSPDVAYNPAANEYMVVWGYEYSVSDHDVYRRRVGGDGTLLEEDGVSTQSSKECMPVIASGGDRSYLIVWEDGRGLATQGMDIYGSMVRPDMLSGRVYKGEVGDESTPLGGVTVELYCSNDDSDLGTLITSTATDSEGWYGLLVSGVCEFYNILETDPIGYTSVGATSVDGTVVTDNWIQYEYPLDGKTLTGNMFWDRPVSTIVECYSCEDCSAKLNGNYPVVLLQNNITNAPNQCIEFNSNNTIFDGQGFTIEWEGVNPEFSYGIQMTGRTGNTIRNCRITDFETGISLRSSDDNNLINNTLFSNLGAGIWLCDSDNNNLINATLFSNRYGIRLLNSHHNNISGNNITQNQNGVGLSSSNFNSFVNNTICKQKEQDIYAFDATSSNTRSGNKCDKIYNWNSDNAYTCCDQVCTADQATTCSSGSELKDALKGDFNYVKFANNLYVPGGIAIDASHVTLDCNGYTISGNGESAGFLLDNLINVTIKDCTIRGFETGIAMPSSSLNNIHNNHIQNNGRGISLFKTSQVKPQGNSIFSNDLRYNRIYGISLSDAEKNYIHTNTVLDSSLYSIWVSGTCDNNITNNYGGDLNNLNPILYWHDKAVGGSVPAGTYSEIIFCNVSHSTIENVDIDNGNTKNDGILLINSKTTHIKNNLVNSTNGVSSINSDDISIYDNDVTFSKSDGISMDHSEDSRIYNNTIENNNGSGILVSVVSNNADIFNNTIKKNYRGIEIRYSDDVKISDNTIHQNTEEGIEIKDSIRTDIFKNDILGNKFGLFFDHHTTQSNARENHICYNSVSDIFDEKLPRFLNTGDDNTCSSYFWKDGSVSDGCLHECVGWYNWKWGYSFHNPRTDDLSFRRYAQTFGKDEVYYTIKICIHPPLCIPFVGCYCAKYILKISTPIPKLFPGIYYLAAYKDLAEGGECYGMSATSLRFYYGHDYPFNYNYSATRVKDLTVNDEYGSHSLRVRREIHHGSQMSAENINYYLWNLGEGNEANYVLNKARGGLKNKNQNMVSIKNGLLNGHVMNYDSVEDFDDGTSKIYVYDNNKEKFVNDLNAYTDKYPAIIVDRNKNSWSYKKNGEVWGSDMIFDIPYSIANRKDWSLPTSLSGISKIIFGDATGNIEDMDGNLLGYDEFNNAYEDIPVGLGVPVFAGDEQPAILAVQPGNYNFNIFGSDGEYSDLIAGLNGAYVLENISSNNNTRDSLEFRMINGNPYYNELSFQTNDVQKPFNVTMFKVFGEDFDCRMYRIFNMNITNESKIYMKVSSDYNSLVFSNRGSDTLTYDVEFQNEMVDIDHYVPDQIPRLLITNLQIDPGQTQTITPENWGSLKNSEVTINTETCGDLICSIGEDHVNCPHDCEEIACVEPHDDMHITESTLLCSGTYPIDDWGDGGVIVIDNDDVVLDCNGAKLDGNGYGIAIISDSTKNVTVKNCYIQNFSTAVMFNNVTNAKIFHSAFISNADSGIELIGSNQSNITQNYIKDNGCGIQIYSSTDTEISQNLVCPNVNIDIYSHTNNVNDTGFDNACGNAQGWDDINTTGCTYKCTYPVCVTPTDDLYINSDTILCPGFYNIPDSGAEGVIIINASDIVLDCNGATLNGTMTGSDYGIYSRGFDNVTIKNCNVMNYLAGIELEMSSNSTITNNNLSLNRYGIYLFYSDYSIITSNTANSNRYKGIGLASSSNNLVANNIVNTNGDGIFLGSFSSNNRIESNTASSNRQAGIYIYGNSSSNDFSNNKINNNLYGIYLGPCICPTCSHYCPGGNFNNTIKANEILDNEIGIFSNQSNSMIDSNMVCNNIELDFNSSDWLTSSGDNNTCNKPDGWNDFEITGCTYSCPSSKGDLNDDGKITTADAAIALQFAASGEWCAEADVDCDGRVTSLDALMILQAAAGNIELQGGES